MISGCHLTANAFLHVSLHLTPSRQPRKKNKRRRESLNFGQKRRSGSERRWQSRTLTTRHFCFIATGIGYHGDLGSHWCGVRHRSTFVKAGIHKVGTSKEQYRCSMLRSYMGAAWSGTTLSRRRLVCCTKLNTISPSKRSMSGCRTFCARE